MSFFRDPKRLLATIIAGVAGLIVLIDFAGGIPAIDVLAETLINWAALVGAFALVVGVFSVAASHFVRVRQRRADWGYSLVLLFVMLAVIFAGIFYPLQDASGQLTVPGSLIERPVRDIFAVVYQPLAASFLALLAFFSLSAVLRAMRRRTLDALVITLVAALVLALASFPQLQGAPMLGEGVRWVSDYLVLASARGLLIGAALGALIAGIRVLLGFDQPYLDR